MSTTVKTKPSSARIALLGTVIALLAGCGNDMDELQAKVDEIKSAPGTGIEPTTGEVHRRHHISPTGFYRGRKVLKSKADA